MRRQVLLPHVSKTLKGIQQSEAYLTQQREEMILERQMQEDGLYVQPELQDIDDLLANNACGDRRRGGNLGEASDDDGISLDGLIVSDGEEDGSEQDERDGGSATANNYRTSELLNLSLSNHGTSLNKEQRANAKSFIENARRAFAAKYKLVNCETVSGAPGEPAYITPPSIVFEGDHYMPIDNYEEVDAALKERLAMFNDEQWTAYNKVKQYLESSKNGENGQLLMFMSGEGGCGKSFVIEAIDMLSKLMFGKGRGKYGATVKWAPTGSSGYLIDGCTWQSGCHLSAFNGENADYRGIGLDLYDAYAIVLDEVSMIGLEDILKMSEHVANARATHFTDVNEQKRIRELPFGGLHVIFCGDFFQLPPPGAGRTPIYEDFPKSEDGKKGREIWKKLNAYVCLVDNKRIALQQTEDPAAATTPGNVSVGSFDDQESLQDKWFACTLSLIRQGFIDADTLAYLNSNCLMTSRTCDPQTQHPVSCIKRFTWLPITIELNII
jgi:hypothetical protein